MKKWLGLLLALVATTAFAAGRVFSDDFENGLAPQWQSDSGFDMCTVVTTAVDGGVPHSGTHQAECNWDATAQWGTPNYVHSHKTLLLPAAVYPYTRELFIRFWARVETDTAPTTFADFFYIYPYDWTNQNLTPYTTNLLGIGIQPVCPNGGCSDTRLGIDWNTEGTTGDGSVPGGRGPDWYGNWYYYDNHIWVDQYDLGPVANWCNWSFCFPPQNAYPNPNYDHTWHKFEIYIKINTPGNTDGFARLWYDGTRIIDVENDTTVNTGAVWGPIELLMTANGAVGANNHVCFDKFEVYTDQGTGAGGLMSDASVIPAPYN